MTKPASLADLATIVDANEIRPIVLETAKAASGTSIEFTGIPSWVRRITLMFNGVGTNGSSFGIVQIGSGSYTTTGYGSQGSNGGTGYGVLTTGLAALGTLNTAVIISGHFTLTLFGSNTWVGSGVHGYTHGTGACTVVGGISPALSGALDRLRVTTVNGTDLYDAGTINIMYE